MNSRIIIDDSYNEICIALLQNEISDVDVLV